MPLVCAIADLGSQDYDVILPTDVVAELMNLPVISVAGPVMNDVIVIMMILKFVTSRSVVTLYLVV